MDEEKKIRDIIYSFREVNQIFYKQMWHHANELGVTIVQLQMLREIKQNPGISLQDLTKKMKAGKSTISGTVDRLVKAGYVKREQSTEDRRAIVLTLTKEGMTKKEEAHATFYQRLAHLNEIDDQDVQRLIELHQLIKEKITISGDDETC